VIASGGGSGAPNLGRMALSARLSATVEALPLRPGARVLWIGCGPGAAARAAHGAAQPRVPPANGPDGS
jgi:hypothetical protein